MIRSGAFGAAGILLLALNGCGGGPPVSPGTGAREAASAFFEDIVRQDWAAAYDRLHVDSRGKSSRDEFTSRAKSYRKKLGFEPAKVRVGVWEEQGDKANAHLVIADANDSLKHSFRDSVLVRKEANAWRVIVPANFGR